MTFAFLRLTTYRLPKVSINAPSGWLKVDDPVVQLPLTPAYTTGVPIPHKGYLTITHRRVSATYILPLESNEILLGSIR
jgi:hypothetical protein